MPDEPPRGRPAAVEDYDSDNSIAKSATRKIANVNAKTLRSSRASVTPKSVKSAKSTKSGPVDAASDSGYSSHTQVTNASIESARLPTAAPTTSQKDVPTSPVKQRDPLAASSKRQSRQLSPAKTHARRESLSRRSDHGRPDASQAREPLRGTSRPRRESYIGPFPIEQPLNVNYPPFTDARRPLAQPVGPSPRSPTGPPPYSAHPFAYGDTPAPRPRPYPSSHRRPMSYSGPSMTDEYWYRNAPPVGPYGAFLQMPPYEDPYAGYRPPYANQYPTTPAPHVYGNPLSPVAPSPSSPTRMRPPLPHSLTENLSARRPAPFTRPIVTHGLTAPRTFETVSAGLPPRRPSLRERRPKMPGAYQNSESAYSSESEDEPAPRRDRDSERMPPPPAAPDRRTSVRYPGDGSGLAPPRSPRRLDRSPHGSRSRSRTEGDYHITRERRHEKASPAIYQEPYRSTRIHRTSSTQPRRPSLAPTETSTHSRRSAAAYSDASNTSHQPVKVIIESRSGRRVSYMGQEERSQLERLRDQERQERQERQHRRDVEAEAEAYQDAVRGVRMSDLTAESIRAQREHDARAPSQSKSRASGISSGSHKSRRTSSSHRRSVGGGGAAGELKIRMDEGTTLEFSGDMEGRTISWRRKEGGGPPELVIGEKKYVDVSSRSESVSRGADGSRRESRSRAGSEARGRRESRTRGEYGRMF